MQLTIASIFLAMAATVSAADLAAAPTAAPLAKRYFPENSADAASFFYTVQPSRLQQILSEADNGDGSFISSARSFTSAYSQEISRYLEGNYQSSNIGEPQSLLSALATATPNTSAAGAASSGSASASGSGSDASGSGTASSTGTGTDASGSSTATGTAASGSSTATGASGAASSGASGASGAASSASSGASGAAGSASSAAASATRTGSTDAAPLALPLSLYTSALAAGAALVGFLAL